VLKGYIYATVNEQYSS